MIAGPHEVAEAAVASMTRPGLVVVHEHRGSEVRFAANTVTTNGVRRQRRVTVVATHPSAAGVSVGVVSAGGGGAASEPAAGGHGPGGWRELVRAAEAGAASAAPSDDAAELVDGPASADFAAPPGSSEFSVLADIAGGLGDAFGRAVADGLVLSGFAEHGVDTVYMASTTGLRLRHEQPTGRVQLVGRTSDGSASSWAGAGTADYSDVSLAALEAEVRRRLAWSARRMALPPGRYPTVLPADAVADLMCMVGEAATLRDAEEGHSVFSRPGGGTRVGERVGALPVELRSDPAEAGTECCPFVVAPASGADVSVFDNGLPLGRTSWIADGVLSRLRCHRAGAARSAVAVAPPVDNLTLELPGATDTVDDLVAGVEHGLLLTCLWYIREVDPVTLLLTGLTRDGVYLVEHGEVTAAVNNFRFNESPVDVLGRATVMGKTRRALSREWNEWFPRTAMSPMVVPDFNMSSVSPAT